MKKHKNPFEYEGANNLSVNEILDFYMEDFNYSRFLQSTRNIFLVGERGTGKTMALLYNSFKIQNALASRNSEEVSYGKVGIHIPCNTPIFHKKEHLLIEDGFRASIVCEHYLVLSIISEIAQALSEIPAIEKSAENLNIELKEEFEYMLGVTLHKSSTFLSSIRKFVGKAVVETQKDINSANSDEFYINAFSFSSLALPFINSIKRIPLLNNSHFMLMIDDAHDLNDFQVKTLNSWIAYRDHSDFSFKIATAMTDKLSYITSTGGSILEGHDFTSVEMGKSFLNKDSEFAKMAKGIVEKRLASVGINITAEEFFPINQEFEKDLEKCKSIVRSEAELKYPDGTSKQINDHVYKYARAEYFRQRSSKANRPPYSSFETIVNISTGVVRNLLDPCYWMYDAELSKSDKKVKLIPPVTQNHTIIERSDAKWLMLRNLQKSVDGCTEEQAKAIYNMFDNLMMLFRERLLKHKSEPRAIKFSISQREKTYAEVFKRLQVLLDIAQKAQLLYTRPGNAKEDGKLDTFYVPNRILLPSRGLDPHGQYAHVQLKAIDILSAAETNKPFPPIYTDDENNKSGQTSLSF